MLQLFENEKTINQLGCLYLTNFRLVMEIKKMHDYYKHSILLKNIAAVQIVIHRRKKWLYRSLLSLLIAIVSAYIYSFASHGQYDTINENGFFSIIGISHAVMIAALIIAGFYLILYYFLKKRGLVVSSQNTDIFFASDHPFHDLVDFVNDIEVAMVNYTVGTIVIKKK